MSTRDEVARLRETGLNYAEIGRRLGISRERVRQILKGNPKPKKPNPKIQKTDLHPKLMLTTSDLARLLGLHPKDRKSTRLNSSH